MYRPSLAHNCIKLCVCVNVFKSDEISNVVLKKRYKKRRLLGASFTHLHSSYLFSALLVRYHSNESILMDFQVKCKIEFGIYTYRTFHCFDDDDDDLNRWEWKAPLEFSTDENDYIFSLFGFWIQMMLNPLKTKYGCKLIPFLSITSILFAII